MLFNLTFAWIWNFIRYLHFQISFSFSIFDSYLASKICLSLQSWNLHEFCNVTQFFEWHFNHLFEGFNCFLRKFHRFLDVSILSFQWNFELMFWFTFWPVCQILIRTCIPLGRLDCIRAPGISTPNSPLPLIWIYPDGVRWRGAPHRSGVTTSTSTPPQKRPLHYLEKIFPT